MWGSVDISVWDILLISCGVRKTVFDHGCKNALPIPKCSGLLKEFGNPVYRPLYPLLTCVTCLDLVASLAAVELVCLLDVCVYGVLRHIRVLRTSVRNVPFPFVVSLDCGV